MAGTGTVSTFDPNTHNLLELRRALQGIHKQVPIASYDWSGTDPGVNDDITKGWRVGSVIVKGTVMFVCSSNAEGAAVWQQLGATNAVTGGSMAAADIVEADDYLIVWDLSASLNKRVTVAGINAAGIIVSATEPPGVPDGSLWWDTVP